MPGRLMVGRMALGPCSEGSSPSRAVITLLLKRRQVKPVESSPDDYIANQEPGVREVLDELHTLIKKALPGRDFLHVGRHFLGW